MESAQDIVQMILDGKEKQLRKIMPQLSWRDHCLTILKICEAAGRAQLTGAWQRMAPKAQHLMSGAVNRFRERLERITPQDMITIAGNYYETTRGTVTQHYAAVLLGCPQTQDSARSIRLFSLFNSARIQLWEGLQKREDWAASACIGLHLMFGGLISDAPRTRTWFYFLRAVAAGDALAKKQFERICIFPGIFSEYNLTFVPYQDWIALPCSKPRSEEDILAYLFTTHAQEPRTAVLPAPFEIAQSLNRIMQELLERYEQGNNRLMHLLTWFHAQRKIFGDAKQAMWREMQTSPRAALRPGGQDWVKISVADLNTPVAVYFGVALVPLDPFPGVEARFDSLFFGEPCTFTIRLENPTAYSESLIHGQDHPDRILRELLEFLVVDSCWRIITDNDAPALLANIPAAIVQDQGAKQRPRKTIRHTGLQIFVRAKFKKLPKGFHASQAAIERALADSRFRTAPPDGTTFRRDYIRGHGANAAPADSSPLFVYSEKDLGYDSPESV